MSSLKEALIKLMQNKGIELVSSHDKLCFPIIERIYRKMTIGLKFDAIKVNNKLIIDGHHRYLASILSAVPLDQVPVPKSSVKVATDWKNVALVDDDWDTVAKIDMLNELDARYNGLTIEELIEKIK